MAAGWPWHVKSPGRSRSAGVLRAPRQLSATKSVSDSHAPTTFEAARNGSTKPWRQTASWPVPSRPPVGPVPAKRSTASSCGNYGTIGANGSVHWPHGTLVVGSASRARSVPPEHSHRAQSAVPVRSAQPATFCKQTRAAAGPVLREQRATSAPPVLSSRSAKRKSISPQTWHGASQNVSAVSPRNVWWVPARKSLGGLHPAAVLGHYRARSSSPQQRSLPTYSGWPTPGPSEDATILKMRQARLCGHVDWITWSREANDMLHVPSHRSRSMRPAPAAAHSKPLAVNMSLSRTLEPQEEEILEPQGSFSGDEDIIPCELFATLLEQPLTKASAQQSALLEAQRSWVLLRSAYLAGADSQLSPWPPLPSKEPEPADPGSEHVDLGSWAPSQNLRAKLEQIKHLTRALGLARTHQALVLKEGSGEPCQTEAAAIGVTLESTLRSAQQPDSRHQKLMAQWETMQAQESLAMPATTERQKEQPDEVERQPLLETRPTKGTQGGDAVLQTGQAQVDVAQKC